MSRGRRLTPTKFRAIAKDLNDHPHLTQRSIGESHHVSASLVCKVDNAVTWRNYRRGAVASKSIRERVLDAPKRERAERAGLHPTLRIAQAAQTFISDLNNLETTPTRDEFRDLERRITILSVQQSAIASTPVIGGVIRRRMERAVQALPGEGR